MQLTKISRSKSFEMVNEFGLKYWDKIGIEADLGENEDPKECYQLLGQLIDETHKEKTSEISFVAGNPPVSVVQVERLKMSPEEELIQNINSCTTLDGEHGLLSYRIPASLNPATKSAYDLKVMLLKK